MKNSHLRMLALVAATLTIGACAGGSGHQASTTTDTTVTPVKVRDTTVVEKKVDVTTDTLKKTHNKP